MEVSREIAPAEQLYLDLLKKCLTRYMFPESYEPLEFRKRTLKGFVYEPIRKLLVSNNIEMMRRKPFEPERRANGYDIPSDAETMIGLKRLDNIQYCITEVLKNKIPGDLIETGVWRGGSCIFMRAVLKVLGDRTRKVWVADSFRGLPKPDEKGFPADRGLDLSTDQRLAVSLETVKSNFERYGMLDEQVSFLPGWFKDTLPTAPIERLAVLRADGDLYESTTQALRYLYPKLSIGGFVIIDDYGLIPACRKAVDDFRMTNKIDDEIKSIDYTGIFWKRSM